RPVKRRNARFPLFWGTVMVVAALLVACVSDTEPKSDKSPVPSATPAESGLELEPSSSDLIATAVEAGEIDEPTALLYRTWLLFGDPQLPDEFVGVPESHDLNLVNEIRDELDDLPSDV